MHINNEFLPIDMDFKQSEMIESARGLLISSDLNILTKTVNKLLDTYQSDNEKDARRILLVRLLHTSIELENINLAVILTDLLGARQLTKIAKNATDKSGQQRKLVLNILGSHIEFSSQHVDHTKSNDLEPYESIGAHITQPLHKNFTIATFYHSSKDWDNEQNNLIKLYNAAIFHETNEDFRDALSNYEKAGAEVEHLPRATMKHLLCSTHQALQKYCATNDCLRGFWLKYLTVLHDSDGASQFCLDIGSLAEYAKYNQAMMIHGEEIPEAIMNRISVRNTRVDAKLLRLTSDMIASSSTKCRTQLAGYLTRELQFGQSNKFEHLALYLGLKRKFYEQSNSQDMIGIHGSTHDIVYSVIDSSFVVNTEAKKKTKSNSWTSMLTQCLRIGSINMALRFMMSQSPGNVEIILRVTSRLEEALEAVYQGDLDEINPILEDQTLSALDDSLRKFDDIDLAMHVMTIIMLSSTIFLLKLSNHGEKSKAHSLSALERMFSNLESLIGEFQFNLSESLLHATSGLTLAIKNNLDTVGDSQIIRESFRKLIETVAGKCMIESRYKNAAMLYSHIDDNVNAIKSLMRTGDIETVINYALLVKDFTVNRITINYLKHLKVESTILENFISKSQI